MSTNGSRFKPRAERCFSRVAKRFSVEMSEAFMDNFFGPDKVAFAKGMAKDIRVAYDARLKASAWRYAPTKAAAVSKLAAMKLVVADNTPSGPEDNMADVVCTKDDYASSYLSANVHLWRVQWHRLVNPRAPHQASLRIWRTNERHDGYRNEIYIPAATLSLPTFSSLSLARHRFGASASTWRSWPTTCAMTCTRPSGTASRAPSPSLASLPRPSTARPARGTTRRTSVPSTEGGEGEGA